MADEHLSVKDWVISAYKIHHPVPFRINSGILSQLSGNGCKCIISSWNIHFYSSVPVPPSDDEVVPFTNATSITVFLSTWRSGGCPIQHFSIEYKNSSDNVWIKASTNYPSTNPIYTIRGLRPLTGLIQVTAVNSAAQCTPVHQSYDSYRRETVPSITPSQEHPKVLPFLDDPKKYVPVVGLMTIILFGIFLGYFVFQRRERLQKEREKARLAAAIAERERHSSLNSSPRRHDVINGNPMTPEREPFLGTPVRIEHPLPSRQSPWVFHTDGSQEVDVNCNGRPDTYGGYGYRGSYRRSLATFRTDEEGSDSLSDLGAAAPHIRERVYDQPPVERSISTHTYARLDDFHGVPPAVPGRPVQFFTSDHACGNSSHAQPDSETSASQQDEKPPSLNSIGTNTSSNREELERLYANACRLQQMNYQSPHSSTQYSSSQSHSSPSKNYDRPPRRSRESRDSRHRRQSSKGRITGGSTLEPCIKRRRVTWKPASCNSQSRLH
ncbi:putative Down syndrome cell adhesion molecule-like [Apostichopus japonicus]|uniref:Putative Down syndrome cell adhesion molecule-like n=1 Tax=Stichopus japonicus TaxID=307972 RepID=A0A2G8L3A6_STIJA|nr:putative Down syndrome cell adhesion molecule-like [Apostichopus japonicus]